MIPWRENFDLAFKISILAYLKAETESKSNSSFYLFYKMEFCPMLFN